MLSFYFILCLILSAEGIYLLPEDDAVSDMTSLRNEVIKMKETVSSLQSQSRTQEQKFAAVLSNVLSSITSLKHEHNSSMIEMQEQLRSTQQGLQSKLNMSTADLEDVKSKLSEAENKIASYESELSILLRGIGNTSVDNPVSLQIENLQTEVSFQANLPPSGDTRKNNEKLVFDRVKVNIGKGYDPKSGVFTAPVPGTYIFWAHILLAYKGTDKSMTIKINSTKGLLSLSNARVDNKMFYSAATPTMLAMLNKGEKVWFQVLTQQGFVNIIGSQFSSFGGTLIRMH